jgi:hypothetical protein
MPLLTDTVIDHTRCPPGAHRHDANAVLGEPHSNGSLICSHCGNRMVFCTVAAEANNTGGGYQRSYFHPNPVHEESCR